MPDKSLLNELKARLRGDLIRPGDADYDAARKVYNGMIDRRPAAIARCADVADVIEAVKFAREHKLLLAVRAGGHNAGGLGVCDDGLVIDLSRLRGIRVDPAARTASVEAGCTLGDVDHATGAFGLAVPTGILSTTGIAGLTLGGGIGNLSRSFGLTIDHLIAADVVLADGRLVRASARKNPDLFWALRGGGGNFGIVTNFEFRLRPVGRVHAGPTFWPIEKSADVLRWYGDFIREAPKTLNGYFAFATVPPVPAFPQALHNRKVCGVVWCYCGPEEKADKVFKPVREFKQPLLHGVQPMPLTALQSFFDPLYPPGLQWYWKADFVKDLSEAAIAANAEHGAKLPTLHSTMHMYPIDGAAHALGARDTAFSYRDANWAQVIVGVDPEPVNRDKITRWARDYWDAIHPHSAGGAYINFMMEEGDERIQATYRGNYKRLAAVKRKYDRANLFRVNQNIPPAS
ncbi:MAG: FAD-binding oxidoreductase [Burkholderiales bacterium]|nr:FAD-binding oxidoreductase [Burkholderiales bacterium]